MDGLSRNDLQFQKELPETLDNIECPLCLEVILEEPCQASCCGQHFCEPWITKHRETSRCPHQCPCCRATGDKFAVFKDRNFGRFLSTQIVYCTNKEKTGCTWVGEFRQIRTHLTETCGQVKCPHPGCPKGYIPRYNLKRHKEKECSARPYKCKYCGLHDTYHYIKRTHYPECPLYPVDCPFKCIDDAKIPRCNIQDHLNECPLNPIDCKYSRLGCREMPLRKDSDEHHLQPHTKVLVDTCDRLLYSLQQSREESKAEQDKLQRKINHLTKEKNNLKDELKRQYDLLDWKVKYEINGKLAELSLDHGNLKNDHEKLKNDHEKLKNDNMQNDRLRVKIIAIVILLIFLAYLWFKQSRYSSLT